MVKTFFGKALLQWDFSVSGIACRSTGGGFLFKARFGALLSDEKAMKELWCTKGASSYKPCHLCKNVMGRLDVPPEHPYLVHYTCVDAAQFDLHTPETFREMARQLQEAYTAMSQKRFEKLEQCYGLKYVPLGVLWCEELQDICDPCLPHVLGLDAYFDGVWRYCAVLFQSIYSLFVQSGHYFADTGCVCSRNCLAERCLLVKKVLPKAGGQRGRRAPEGFCKRTVSGDGYSYSFHTTGCGPRWNFAAGNGVCGAHGENHYHSVIPRSCAFKTGCAWTWDCQTPCLVSGLVARLQQTQNTLAEACTDTPESIQVQPELFCPGAQAQDGKAISNGCFCECWEGNALPCCCCQHDGVCDWRKCVASCIPGEAQGVGCAVGQGVCSWHARSIWFEVSAVWRRTPTDFRLGLVSIFQTTGGSIIVSSDSGLAFPTILHSRVLVRTSGPWEPLQIHERCAIVFLYSWHGFSAILQKTRWHLSMREARPCNLTVLYLFLSACLGEARPSVYIYIYKYAYGNLSPLFEKNEATGLLTKF